MTDIKTKAAELKTRCLEVMHAMEESDGGGSRANGGMFDHYFDDIPEWFRPFSNLPDHGQLRSNADTLVQEACKELNLDWQAPAGYEGGLANTNPDLAVIKDIRSNLEGWTGQAAANFRTNYLNRFDQFTKNLYTATYVGYQTLAAEAKLWETASRDIHKIADDARSTVDAMIGVSMGQGFKFVLTSLPSVISVATAPSKDLGLTVVKELAGLGSSLTSQEGFAATPASLMQPLKDSIDQLKKDLKDKEQDIEDALRANLGYLTSHPREYVAPEPKEAGAGSAWGMTETDEPGKEQDGEITLGEDNREG